MGKRGKSDKITNLPPVWIVLVNNLEDISLVKLETSLLAGYQIIGTGVIVKVRFNVYLSRRCLFPIGGDYLEVDISFLI